MEHYVKIGPARILLFYTLMILLMLGTIELAARTYFAVLMGPSVLWYGTLLHWRHIDGSVERAPLNHSLYYRRLRGSTRSWPSTTRVLPVQGALHLRRRHRRGLLGDHQRPGFPRCRRRRLVVPAILSHVSPPPKCPDDSREPHLGATHGYAVLGMRPAARRP
jgi:hypothetical protein